MYVQRRHSPADYNDDALVKIKVSYGAPLYDVSVPLRSTFGYVKKILAHQTGLNHEDQRPLFRGREKDDAEILQAAGVNDLPQLLLMEHPAIKERKIEEVKEREVILNVSCFAVFRLGIQVLNCIVELSKRKTIHLNVSCFTVFRLLLWKLLSVVVQSYNCNHIFNRGRVNHCPSAYIDIQPWKAQVWWTFQQQKMGLKKVLAQRCLLLQLRSQRLK